MSSLTTHRFCRLHIVVGLIALAICLSSCRPHGILSSRKMREVMVELHKTDALLQVSGLQHGHNEAEDIYYALVLERHGITQAQFDSSLVWYTAHPQLFDKIYPKVLKQLEQEREAFTTAHESDLQPFVLKEKKQRPRISDADARRYTDSITWTIQHPRPVYGWIRGWHEIPAEPVVPYLHD